MNFDTVITCAIRCAIVDDYGGIVQTSLGMHSACDIVPGTQSIEHHIVHHRVCSRTDDEDKVLRTTMRAVLS